MSMIHQLRENRRLMRLASAVYRFFLGGRICLRGKGNQLVAKGVFLRNCRIRVSGEGNRIIIEDSKFLVKGMKINISGNHNLLHIGPDFATEGLSFTMEDDNNTIELGRHCRGGAFSELAVIEGTGIQMGDDCMLSAHITVRTGDSHSILDQQSRKRINPSESVVIGDHVWIGNTVLIFKGTQIGSHSMVAGGSVVTGKTFPANCILGGNPAKVLKEGTDWCSERIA